MTGQDPAEPGDRATRAERLAAQLRANLQRRKAQSRGRDAVERDRSASDEALRPPAEPPARD